MEITIGTRLGPYEVVSRISAGGMGEVFRAVDTRLDRSVAIKILPAEFAAHAELQIRFEREAKLISQLNHPHICTLHDIGENYLVMELLDGETVADRLTRGPLPLSQVLRFGAQIAGALDKAHRHGVVHRDLKPGNVMITKSGGAKLLDFGLAKNAVVALSDDGATEHKPLTKEGTILGTFQYMAPEQLEGAEVDPRSDIFALGALLYEMLTGKRAFAGKSKTSLIAAIVSANPQPASELQPLTPPALEHVIQKCLEKNADDRWQSAQDVAEELRWISEIGSKAGVAAPLTVRRRKREALAWIVAAAAIIFASTIAVVVWKSDPVATPVRLTIPGTTADYAEAINPMVSPDGRNAVFRAFNRQRVTSLWIRSLETGASKPIPTVGSEWWPFWSPDSRSIGFFSDGNLVTFNIAGGDVQIIATGVKLPGGGSWGTDGTILFSDLRGGVKRVSADGGSVKTMTVPDASRGEAVHGSPYWLPDGRHFLFLAMASGARAAQHHRLYVADVRNNEVKFVMNVGSRVAYVPSGHLLSVSRGILQAVSFDPKKLRTSGDPIPIASKVVYFPNGYAAFSASAATLMFSVHNAPNRLAWIDRTGKATLIEQLEGCTDLRIDPDGKRVTIAITDSAIGTEDVWLYDFTRKIKTRLTFDPGTETNPEWSPDGKEIIYSSEPHGVSNIYRKRLDGSGEDELLIKADTSLLSHQLFPDGKSLLYDAFENGSWNVKVQTIAPGAQPVSIAASQFDEKNARISPDGAWISYESNESGKDQIYVKGFPAGRKYQVSIDGGVEAKWKNDSSELVWFNGRSVMSADLRGGFENIVARTLLEIPARVHAVDITPNADRILLSYRDETTPAEPLEVILNWSAGLRRAK